MTDMHEPFVISWSEIWQGVLFLLSALATAVAGMAANLWRGQDMKIRSIENRMNDHAITDHKQITLCLDAYAKEQRAQIDAIRDDIRADMQAINQRIDELFRRNMTGL